MKRGDPAVLRLLVLCLRCHARLTQTQFGEAAGVYQADQSRYERGEVAPSEEVQQRMAKAAGVPWPVVVELRRFLYAFVAATKTWASAASFETARLERMVLESVTLAISTYLLEEGIARYRQELEQAKREAAAAWAALAPMPAAERKRLVGLCPAVAGTPALLAEVCSASVRAAAHRVEDAFEVADFALFLAERIPCEEACRPYLRAYARGHFANASRVATAFEEASQEFARVRELWRAGKGPAPEPLSEWRLLDLEASLRREQRRFAESLDLLERALAACGDDAAAGRIWLNKEHLFDTMGDREGALAALQEAAPLVERAGDPLLLFALRFNTADRLRDLKRYQEAADLLPPLRELAAQQGNDLHQIRVRWLTARVAAGLGNQAEATAGLERVQQEFTTLDLPYEAALASLELALLWLAAGRTAEVRELAAGMAWVFQAKEIAREALAALALFVAAAKQETATVELTRRVLADLERAQRSTPPDGE